MIAFLTILGGGIAAAGKGGLDIFRYIDSRSDKIVIAEKEARAKLEILLNGRVAQLEAQVDKLLALNSLYLKRIYQLEATLAEKHIDLPTLKDWPPQ